MARAHYQVHIQRGRGADALGPVHSPRTCLVCACTVPSRCIAGLIIHRPIEGGNGLAYDVRLWPHSEFKPEGPAWCQSSLLLLIYVRVTEFDGERIRAEDA